MDKAKEIISIVHRTIPRGVYSFQEEYYLSDQIMLFTKQVTDRLTHGYINWSNLLALVRTEAEEVFDGTMSLNRCFTATIQVKSGNEKIYLDLLVSVAAPFYSIIFWKPGELSRKIVRRPDSDEFNASTVWLKKFVETSFDTTYVELETIMMGLGEYRVDGVDSFEESTIFHFLFTSTLDYIF